MLTNYLKIALRTLNKNRAYTLLNIGGLATGLACFAFITLWISSEWSYDRFNEKADRIYRVALTIINETESFDQAVSSVPLGPNLKNDYPEIENYVRFDQNDAIVKNETQQFYEEGILLTDPSFFDVFSYRLTQGNPKTALRDPYSLVLTESMAKKYFGNENPIGHSLTILLHDSTGRGLPYKITGVMPDAPKNAHITFNFLASFETLIASDRRQFMSSDAWGENSYYTYVLLKPGVDSKSLAKKLPQFYEKHIAPIMRKYNVSGRTDYTLQPLTDIYLGSHRRYEIGPTSSLNNLYIFGTVGLFILLLAGINYMNLATARSVQRAKEVGVKKVIGALKSQLVSQYLIEAFVLVIISFVLSLGLCKLVEPLFQVLTGKAVSISTSPGLVGFMLGVSLLLGLLSGLYPAFVISSYKPTTVLKGSFSTSAKGNWLRQSLVILQFTITVILLVGILVIHAQMSFIQNKDLGYSKDALLTLNINGDRDVETKIEAFKNDVLGTGLVKGMTTSSSNLVGGLGNNGINTIDNQGKKISTSMYRLAIDYDYLNVMGMKLIAGRNLSREFPADARTDSTQNYLLNESAVKALGWKSPNDAIGKPFAMSNRQGTVVGIVGDFHFNSLQHKVEPLAMLVRGDNFARIILKLDMQHPQESIAWVERQWKTHFPTSYLDYSFLDKKLNGQYQAESRFATIFFYFSLLAVLIACLGLYGLTAFATQQRTKEIGVRKVLGASVTSILTLLSKDFLKLVLIATVIASPLAWYAMNQWLKGFAYKIDIQWWMFALAGLLVVGVALLTVSFQSVKAALMNPVKSLRSE
ncbi:FtsX-like permease family protein [Spirosoma sp. HMF4905]|uniref:FtsX-like permease family protein n=1 Tax=Spirosoma arboris TaxID=2682092 RepID=A0A7K1SAH0_9BACT|nr:ABC transporter permease [Spirosoma arboris]MVM30780.1 FtsX-like permease family protein [Spirosoma arboris]